MSVRNANLFAIVAGGASRFISSLRLNSVIHLLCGCQLLQADWQAHKGQCREIERLKRLTEAAEVFGATATAAAEAAAGAAAAARTPSSLSATRGTDGWI